MPSDRFKLAFKTALAMVLAYGVALAMNWQNPYWAGLAVALCSLSTSGESLLKGLLRVSGTLLALVVSLSLIALFPQERWAFMSMMSLFVGFCTYMAMGTTRWYFWLVAGFSVPLLSVAGGADGLNDFNTVMLRLQETILGVVSFTLVSIVLWPVSSQAAFEKAFAGLVEVHRDLFRHYLSLAVGRAPADDAQAGRLRAAALSSRLGPLLDAAVLDSYQIDEARHVWRRSLRLLRELDEALEAWRQCIPETAHLYLPGLLPGNRGFIASIEDRFAGIEAILSGAPPPAQEPGPDLQVQEAAVADLTHFDRAALRLFRDKLLEIDVLTRSLTEAVAEARGFAPLRSQTPERHKTTLAQLLDPDRWAAVLRVEVAVWLAILIVLYVPSFPDATTLLVLAVSFSVSIVKQMPHVRVFGSLPAILVGILVGATAHILIMPNLTSFSSLAFLIFAVVFLASFFYWQPRQMILKTSVVILFLMLAQIDNEQQYNALGALNLGVTFVFLLLILSISGFVPISQRAETAIMTLLRRFFKNCEGLISSGSVQWHRSICLHAVASLPEQMPGIARALPPDSLEEKKRQQFDGFVAALQILARRLLALDRARGEAQSEVLVRELGADARNWRVALEEIFHDLSKDPAATEPAALQTRLDIALLNFEQRIDETIEKLGEGAVSAHESENMYRLLGAYRGLSQSLIEFSDQAAQVAWERMREARF